MGQLTQLEKKSINNPIKKEQFSCDSKMVYYFGILRLYCFLSDYCEICQIFSNIDNQW